jgi:uncharacterized membrane protein YjgN (DUF898 family)
MEQKNFRLSFVGNGMDLFKIQIVNFILNVITLGLYYPWAKATKLQYIYSNTVFEDHPFAFTGTGKEMFKGFIKAILFIVLAYAAFFSLVYVQMLNLAILLLYAFLFLMIPLIIHGSYKYRMAKTVWKGIRFGYTGNRAELFKLYLKWVFLTIVTFGIYGAWLSMNLRKYVVERIRVGDANFIYKGTGDDYFILNLKGYFLTLITLGIYMFWWQKELFEYFVNNLELNRQGKRIYFRSSATGGGFFSLLIVNFLIIVFTLGLGFSWTVVRTLKYVTENIQMQGDLLLEELEQAQGDYTNATGEDLADIFDFGFVI